ncbi:MAG TPA: DUF2292 domain-containing protein [Bacillota bacterium]|nr:DUF2292 domain-containing protein [Bacillota bacterium]HOL09527.1 DUF2292 domain-containing protein [Bacillota bacterium]HPO98687.1 DUF2292 domain-containing protein [Bacillota bacterium]
MPIANKKKQLNGNVFEQTILQALNNVKNGSITVVKQDNVVIQVNISEQLDWTYSTAEPQTKSNRLRVV